MNRQILPWAIGVVLVLILAVVLVANIGKKSDSNTPTVPAGTAVANVTIAPTTSGSSVTTGSSTTPGASKTTAAGGTTAASTTAAATTAAATTKTATVQGTGGDGLNMRETPSKTGTKVTSIKDGEKVTIKDGPKDAEGITWYQIEYQGKTGWASSQYLNIQS